MYCPCWINTFSLDKLVSALHVGPENLRNINSLRRSKIYKPHFTQRQMRKSQQLTIVSLLIKPEFPNVLAEFKNLRIHQIKFNS